MKLKAICVKDGNDEVWYRADDVSVPNGVFVKSITCQTSYNDVDWNYGFEVTFRDKVMIINPRFVWSAVKWNTEK